MKIIAAFLALLLITFPAAWAEDMSTVQRDITKVTLVSENTAIAPGQPFNVGVLLEPKDGWHTYWENPGDAGMATTLTWTLPAGFSAGSIQWPAPQRMMEGPLVIYAYPGKVFLPITITPPGSFTAAGYPVKVKASWLVCKDICIPESADLALTLPVAKGAPQPTDHAPLFAQARQERPRQIVKHAAYRSDAHTLTLAVPLNELNVKDIHSAVFFPRQENIIRYAGEQKLATGKDTLRLTIDKADAGDAPNGVISGILTLTAADNQQKSFDIAFNPGDAAAPVSSPEAGQAALALPAALLLAVLGGLILNLMPCVLPVLSLKALAIVKKSAHAPAAVVRQGVAYTLGILASFAVIAGILLALRSAGAVIGWGYQMQSPAFVGFLVYLLFLVGLSLSGLFHLPVLLGSAGGDINESSAKGSFLTGVLAAAVATPCTAPFMASAVGIALTLPAFEALLVFEALGFGLALPFLLISLFPRLRHFLPKPGAWMEAFKQLLAFPMYASVIWLLWVLTLQTGAAGMAIAACGMLMMVFAIWLNSSLKSGHARTAIILLLAVMLISSLPALSRLEIGVMGHTMEAMDIDYSKDKLAQLRAAGTPVFVDATAAWCITCQLNGRTVLHSERVMQAFKDRGITLMVADWTRRNDSITEFLDSFGYKGVPLYVFYPAGDAKPVVLPQLLTEDIITNAIKSKGD